MARAQMRSRPPLPRFAVAWFPAFDGLEAIEAFRRHHDPASAFIPAHLSLVFAFPTALTRLQISTHVRRVASRWPPIPVTFTRVRTESNEYVFLMAARGAQSIKGLHERLYTRSLAHHRRRDLPYEPHITLARHGEYARLQEALAHAAEEIRGEHEDVIRDVTLLAVGQDGRIERLETIALNSP